jgi:hypothetical protein
VTAIEASLRESVLRERREALHLVLAREDSDSQIDQRSQLDRQSGQEIRDLVKLVVVPGGEEELPRSHSAIF